jgi:hypothetical protein
MIWIRKNMPVSPASTKALTAVTTVVPCMKVGENCYEYENEWQQVMEDHTAEDSTRQEMAHEARDRELAKATVEVEGRVYAVTLLAEQTRSAEQARAFGKTLLMWCAQRSTESRIMPENTVPPEARTTEQKQEVVEHWLQHRELSIVARRAKARYVDTWKKHDRKEQEPPWMVTMTLSDASIPGGYLGKRVGVTALGFEL